MTVRAGSVEGGVRLVMRAEGFAVLAAAVLVYASTGHSWWTFAALLLAPDLALLGYFAGARTGAFTYNAVHSYIGPLTLALATGGEGLGFALSIIWLAHCGLDRAAGYGLKYASGFGNTHLGRVGRAPRVADTEERAAPSAPHHS